jgi:hypothetical protein
MTGILGALIGSKMFSNFWTQGTAATSLVYNGAAYADLSGGKYFAFGSSNTGGTTTTYNYSSDGTSWSSGTLPTSYEWGAPKYNGTNLVAFPSGDAVSGPSSYYTSNGTTWTAASLPFSGTAYRVFDCIWDGTRFLGITSSTGSEGIVHSTTGTSWSGTDVGNGGVSIAYDGSSRYVVLSNASTATHRTNNSDPTVAGDWSNITLPSSGVWTSVVYGNGIWVAFRAGSSSYGYSTNGTTWTAGTLPSIFSSGTAQLWVKGLFYNNTFYYYYLHNLYSSSDGINWSTVQTFESSFLEQATGWATNLDKVVAVGNRRPTSGTNITLIGE